MSLGEQVTRKGTAGDKHISVFPVRLGAPSVTQRPISGPSPGPILNFSSTLTSARDPALILQF